MEEETYLAIYYDDFNQKIKTSINEVKDWLDNNNKEDLSNFIYHRLHSRYLKPFQYNSCECEDCFKNGFSMLANYCLLIEAIQSFKKGLEVSSKMTGWLFEDFFIQEKELFPSLENSGQDFYKNVRCGILHQGETLHGWKVTREETKLLFDNSTKTINATKFGEQMEMVLKNYKKELEESDINSLTWKYCKKKLNHVISVPLKWDELNN